MRGQGGSEAPSARGWAEAAAVALLGAGVVAGPLFVGGTWVWARLAIEAAMATAVLLWACSAKRSLPLLVLPLLAAGIALAQIVPLPDRLLVGMAPVSAGAWKTSAPGLWGTISIDPGATAAAGRRLMLGLASTVVVADLGRALVHRRRLIWSLAASGLIVWSLALLFPVNNLDRVLLGFIDLKSPTGYWQTSVDPPWQTSGVAYVNRATVDAGSYAFEGGVIGDGMGCFISSNQFANFLVLTIPVAVAAWLHITRGRLHVAIRVAVAAAILAGAAWTTGVVAKSRAGTGALLFACIVLVNLVVDGGWPRRLAEAATVASTAAVVLFCGVIYGPLSGIISWLPAGLQPHIATLINDPRVMAARVALRMFQASPLLGTGLDTFGDVFPRFQPGDITLLYAHNDYAQLLAEAGLVGAAVAIGLGSVLLVRGHRFYWRVPPAARLLEAGPWAAVAGLAFHAAFDWNMHVPANALAAGIVMGICAATGGRSRPQSTSVPARVTRIGCTALLACGTVAALAMLTRDAVSETVERRLRTAVTWTRLADDELARAESRDRLTTAIEAGDRMTAWDSRNSRLPLLLGQARLHLAGLAAPAEAGPLPALAAESFERARRRCGMLRGVPEPFSQPKPR
jgi:O-antigen ligase